MGRGYCYEISDLPEEIHVFGESDLDERAPYETAYVEHVPGESAEIIRHKLLEGFKKHGAVVGEEVITNGCGDEVSVPYVIFSSEMKCNYFRDRFTAFKSAVQEWDVEDFADVRRATEADTCKRSLYFVKRMLEDRYGDAVWFGDSFYTLDSFLRIEAVPDRKYYLGNIVFMH